MTDWKLDCRHFLGHKPCRFKRTCPECPHYSPYDHRILIIKLAAVGDVLRTTVLLSALKDRYPNSQVTWLSEPGGVELLKGLPEIDRLMTADLGTLEGLRAESFDRLYCFDKEPLATGLATKVQAQIRIGFGQNSHGALIPLNPASQYAYDLGLDDELKFRKNTKTYPEIVYEMSELEYKGQEYRFEISPEEGTFAQIFAENHGLDPSRPIIGINTGCGPVFQMKKWPVENLVAFIDLVGSQMDAQVLLYGGPAELELHRAIKERVNHPVIDTGCQNSLREFAALIELCDVLITGDTMAMHLGIALKKQVVLLIGSTSWTEIDLFGRGQKLITDFPCAPCYKRICDFDPWCLQEIHPEQVLQAVQDCLLQVRS